MKKFATIVFSFLLLGMTTKATTVASEENEYSVYDGNAYIFTEGGVEFSVFPDGQFDFVYIGSNQGNDVQVSVSTPNVNVSFNSGHDYEMFVQYDDYGAVIQVEDVAVYYDGYGRITQAGNVDIQYNDRRVVRVGGLHINYNHYGQYVGHTGYINVYNRYYVARPWHVFYTPPIFSSCIVYDYPYRSHYSPYRYSYGHHRQYYSYGHHKYKNSRRDFYRPGSRVHYKNGRSAVNKSYKPNRRNTMVADNGRNRSNTTRDYRNADVGKNRNASTNRDRNTTTRGSYDRTGRNTTVKNSRSNNTGRSTIEGNSRNSTVNKRTATTTRGTSKGNTRSSNIKKRSTTTTRNTTKGNTRSSSTNKRTAATTKNTSTRINRNANTKGTSQKRNSVARSSRTGNDTKRSSTARTASTKRVSKSSNGSRANKSSQRSSSHTSRGKTSKRGRG